MQTAITRRIRAHPDTVFRLAAAVEDWPRLLPHYRGVRMLREDGSQRLVEMAARRDWIPVRWTAVQVRYPVQRRITFEHVGGITRGMDVAWTLVPAPDEQSVQVTIWHGFSPGWPLVPDWLVQLVVGRLFVDYIAGKTLRRIAELAEREQRQLTGGNRRRG